MTGQKSDTIFEQRVTKLSDHGLKHLAMYHNRLYKDIIAKFDNHDKGNIPEFYLRRRKVIRDKLHTISKEQKRRFDNISNR